MILQRLSQKILHRNLRAIHTFIAVLIIIIAAPFFTTCAEDTFNEDRYVIINVQLTPALYPVDDAHPLWAVLFLSSDWTNELFRVSSGTTQLTIPLFKSYNLDEFIGYIAVVYDSTGTGNLQNQQCIGFQNSQYPAALDTVAFLEIKVMNINVDLDSGTNNFPYP
ncbi:MAG: hypothetical protein A2W19_13405 [Spirochaetes bacterium RBG_16_49_21]|nr:MAG: hypothetical protein A2W19_13405 [Spirochaetes bacterium RBG_16_49_21]